MALEQDLQALTAAIVALTARIPTLVGVLPPAIPAVTETAPTAPAAEPKPASKPRKLVTVAEPEKKLVTVAADAPAVDMRAGAPVPATYEQAAQALTAMMQRLDREAGTLGPGRAAGLALLKKYGVEKLPLLKPENYGALIAECGVA